MGRKPGVMEPEDLKKFVEAAGDKLIVVDARNPDFTVEAGDAATHAKAPIGDAARPRSVNVVFDAFFDGSAISLSFSSVSNFFYYFVLIRICIMESWFGSGILCRNLRSTQA